MSCECLATCKADSAAKQTRYLGLINSLATSGVSQDLSQMYSYFMDDINRLRGIVKRLEELQAIITEEMDVSPTDYYSASVRYGIEQELIKIKALSEADYLVLSGILGITVGE